MSLRKLKRSVVKHQMKQAGVKQMNKSSYKYVDDDGKSTNVRRQSFFAAHWQDK